MRFLVYFNIQFLGRINEAVSKKNCIIFAIDCVANEEFYENFQCCSKIPIVNIAKYIQFKEFKFVQICSLSRITHSNTA